MVAFTCYFVADSADVESKVAALPSTGAPGACGNTPPLSRGAAGVGSKAAALPSNGAADARSSTPPLFRGAAGVGSKLGALSFTGALDSGHATAFLRCSWRWEQGSCAAFNRSSRCLRQHAAASLH